MLVYHYWLSLRILKAFATRVVRVLVLLSLASSVFGQAATPTPSPTPANDQQTPIKIFTEEVVIPVAAYDDGFRFDPTLEIPDILLFENGIPQEIQSLRRVPASVLLLLDTSGELNPAMKTKVTRDLAVRLLSLLRTNDRVAAIQFGGRVELIQAWTTDRKAALESLKAKVFSHKSARLADALTAGTNLLREVPMGSRHVVLITDGTEAAEDKGALVQAVENLLAVQATVHVVSYTVLGRKTINRLFPKYLAAIRFDKRKSAKDIADEIVKPNDLETLEDKARKIQIVLEHDFRLGRLNRQYAKKLKANEEWLTALANESGGLMMLPQSPDEILKQADQVALDIDSHYVVTYKPKRSFASAPSDEYRRIEVAPRRAGLKLRTRRGYVITPPPK